MMRADRRFARPFSWTTWATSAACGFVAAAACLSACSLIDTDGLSADDDASALGANGDGAVASDSVSDATLANDGADVDASNLFTDATVGTSADAPADGNIDAGPLTYAARILADHPIAYFRLGDQGVIAASEVNATTYPGVYSGSYTEGVPGAIDGDPNTAIHFPGANGAITLGDVFEFANDASFSFEIWVRVTAAPDGIYRRVLGRESPTGSPTGYNLLYASGGAGPNFTFNVGGNTVAELAPNTALALGQWTHLVITYNGTEMNMYRDAILVAVAAVTTPTGAPEDAGSVAFRLGADPNTFSQWNGDLDEFAVYDKALDVATIDAHFAAAGAHDAGPFDAATVH